LSTTNRIQLVLFELEGTLVTVDDFEAWAVAASLSGIQVDTGGFARALDSLSPNSNSLTPAAAELWGRLIAKAGGAEVSPTQLGTFLRNLESLPYRGGLYSDARKCFERLRMDRRRTGVVSAWRSGSEARGLLASLGVSEGLAPILGVEDWPEPGTARDRTVEVFNQLAIRPHTTVLVGDGRSPGFLGLHSAGIRTIGLHRQSTGESTSELEVLSLSEVPRVVRELDRAAGVK
jgi:phosphoglycolate phosphatase-like HAD superfamily hydrolase